jgi:hypothetical protein
LSRAAAAAAIWALCVAACSQEPPRDAQFLASDLHFTIGGQHIVTPVVAIDMPAHFFDLNSRKPESVQDRFGSQASDPHHPMSTDLLDLQVMQYRYRGDNPRSRIICPLLTRKWSQAICLQAHGGLLRRLPGRFVLLDRNKLDFLQYRWTVGMERQYDQVKGLALQPDVAEIGCDKKSKFCTAALEVLPGLLAVWTVWSDENTGVTAQAMAHAQGAALIQFVRRGLGPAEDQSLVDAT